MAVPLTEAVGFSELVGSSGSGSGVAIVDGPYEMAVPLTEAVGLKELVRTSGAV